MFSGMGKSSGGEQSVTTGLVQLNEVLAKRSRHGQVPHSRGFWPGKKHTVISEGEFEICKTKEGGRKIEVESQCVYGS